MRSYLVAVVFAVSAGCFGGAASAQQCDVFTDVLASDNYCPAVQWLKNRQVTVGCTADMYCPNANVSRSQMALFMNRLGSALSPEILYNYGQPGAITVQSVAPYGVHCVTADSTSTIGTLAKPLDHPTAAVITTTFSGLADNTIVWRSVIAYSTDAGTTWTAIPTGNAHRASSAGGQWSEVTNAAVMPLAPGFAYRFSIVVARDDASTGNFTDSRCQLVAAIHNQNGSTPPY